MTGLGSDLRAG